MTASHSTLSRPLTNLDDLHAAVLKRNANLVTQILKRWLKKDRANFLAKLNKTDDLGCTALHYAVLLGATNIVTELLKYQADTNIQDKNGYSSLHYACYTLQVELVKLLLSIKGININSVTLDDYTPLDLVDWNKNGDKQKVGRVKQLRKILIEHGAKKMRTDRFMKIIVKRKLLPKDYAGVCYGLNGLAINYIYGDSSETNLQKLQKMHEMMGGMDTDTLDKKMMKIKRLVKKRNYLAKNPDYSIYLEIDQFLNNIAATQSPYNYKNLLPKQLQALVFSQNLSASLLIMGSLEIKKKGVQLVADNLLVGNQQLLEQYFSEWQKEISPSGKIELNKVHDPVTFFVMHGNHACLLSYNSDENWRRFDHTAGRLCTHPADVAKQIAFKFSKHGEDVAYSIHQFATKRDAHKIFLISELIQQKDFMELTPSKANLAVRDIACLSSPALLQVALAIQGGTDDFMRRLRISIGLGILIGTLFFAANPITDSFLYAVCTLIGGISIALIIAVIADIVMPHKTETWNTKFYNLTKSANELADDEYKKLNHINDTAKPFQINKKISVANHYATTFSSSSILKGIKDEVDQYHFDNKLSFITPYRPS